MGYSNLEVAESAIYEMLEIPRKEFGFGYS